MPSFTALVRQARRTRSPDDPVWAYDRKLDGRALARSLGIRVPELLAGPADRLADIDLPDRPCVLKPNRGAGGNGVFVLRPAGQGRWRLRDGRTVGWQDIQREAAAAVRRTRRRVPHDQVTPPWFAENLVHGDDFKFYCAGRRALLCKQRRTTRRGKVFTFWDPDGWTRLGQVERLRIAELPPPRDGAALIHAAETVAAHVQAPFVRVDLYEDQAGPVFGEITPEPGPRVHGHWDRVLGQAWRDAERHQLLTSRGSR